MELSDCPISPENAAFHRRIPRRNEAYGQSLSVLARQCLSRRIPDAATLAAEVGAWEAARNRAIG